MYPHTRPTCPSFKLKHTCQILGGTVKLVIHKDVTNHIRVRTHMTFKKGSQKIVVLDGWGFDTHGALDIDSDISDEMYYEYVEKCIASWMFESEASLNDYRYDDMY